MDDDSKTKIIEANWSIQDACHGGQVVQATKSKAGEVHGKNFKFTWAPN
jgi:hypothetical protein